MSNLVSRLRLGASISRDRNLKHDFAEIADLAADEICSLQMELAELHAKFYTLSEEFKGPDGYATWKDAAVAERIKRVKLERENKLQNECYNENH